MFKQLLALACAIMCAPVCAHSVHLDLSVGVSRAIPRHSGTWWQSGAPHKLSLTSPSIELGASMDVAPTFDVKVAAVWLGRNRSDAAAVQDEIYNPFTGGSTCTSNCPEIVHFHGKGWAAGVKALAEWHTTGRAVNYGFHIGPMAYLEAWQMDVPDWYPYVYRNGRVQVLGPIHPLHFNRKGWKLGADVGFSLSRGPFVVSADLYKDGGNIHRPGGDHSFPPIWRYHMIFSIGVRF